MKSTFSNASEAPQLQAFKAENYYIFKTDPTIKDPQTKEAVYGASLRQEGIKLITQYYEDKYHTRISVPTAYPLNKAPIHWLSHQ